MIFVWKVCVKLFLRMGKKFKKQCKEKKLHQKKFVPAKNKQTKNSSIDVENLY